MRKRFFSSSKAKNKSPSNATNIERVMSEQPRLKPPTFYPVVLTKKLSPDTQKDTDVLLKKWINKRIQKF